MLSDFVKMNLSKKNSSKLILFFIVIFAFFIRVWQIDSLPPSLNWDEVSHGYNAYSLLQTGKDEWGQAFPLIFKAYGDYKLPVYIYLTSLSVAVFGLNVFAVRLVSILAGVGLVVLAYLISSKLTKVKVVPVLAAFLTAISPWSLFPSRMAAEANLGAFLFALGIYWLLLWPRNSRLWKLFGASVVWGLSLYTYNSARVLVPLLILLATFLFVQKKRFRQIPIFLLVFLVFSIPLLSQLKDRSGSARFELVSIIDQGTINQIIEMRQKSTLPEVVKRALYNRPTFFAYHSVQNYFKNLSPAYLFLRGGSHYQFSQPAHELLYLLTAPFLLVGLIFLLLGKTAGGKILLFWFFIAFVPSAITRDAPHVLRSLFILPAPMIISALGFGELVEWLKERNLSKGRVLLGTFTLLAVVSFIRWWTDYQQIYPKGYSWAWQYGYQEVVSYVKENYHKYDEVIITKRYGEPHEFVLFWWPWDPQKLRDDPSLVRYTQSDWNWVDAFDKFKFVNDWEVVEKLKMKNEKGKILLVTSPGNYPDGWKLLKVINFVDEKPAFEILEK